MGIQGGRRTGGKIVVYGGLRVMDVPHRSRGGGGDGSKAIVGLSQVEYPLGDVWSYDINANLWERMAVDGGSTTYPGERTAHAATVVGDEMVINGEMKKRGVNPWDGSTEWTILHDVWVFHLQTKTWEERIRGKITNYHTVVLFIHTCTPCPWSIVDY